MIGIKGPFNLEWVTCLFIQAIIRSSVMSTCEIYMAGNVFLEMSFFTNIRNRYLDKFVVFMCLLKITKSRV